MFLLILDLQKTSSHEKGEIFGKTNAGNNTFLHRLQEDLENYIKGELDMTNLMFQTVPNTYILISEMTEKESDGEKGTALF